jgi:hypothetical protein
VLDGTRPKAVAESRLHSSSVKVHGAPSPTWNPWQRGRREQPPYGQPAEFTDLEGPGQVELTPGSASGWIRAPGGSVQSRGRGASRRALRAMGIARKTPSIATKTTTNPTPPRKSRTAVQGSDGTRPRSKSTKPAARIHHRRLITQGTPRFSHGSRGYFARPHVSLASPYPRTPAVAARVTSRLVSEEVTRAGGSRLVTRVRGNWGS